MSFKFGHQTPVIASANTNTRYITFILGGGARWALDQREAILKSQSVENLQMKWAQGYHD